MPTIAQFSQEIFCVTLDAMPQKVVLLNRDGCIVHFNRAWQKFLHRRGGRNRPSLLGSTLQSHPIIKGAKPYVPLLGEHLDRVVIGVDVEFSCTLPADKKASKWLQLHATHLTVGTLISAVVTFEDVSDAYSAQRTIDSMSLRLAELRQEERQRIALELHDSTAQHLAAANLILIALRNRLTKSAAEISMLDQVDKSLHAALHEVQVTSFLLYPADLAQEGIAVALGNFVSTYARQTGIETRLRARGLDELEIDLQRAILRIVQEALVNIHRHAESRRARICLRRTSDCVVLRVADEGKGMCAASAIRTSSTAGTGLGIAGMRARAGRFGG